MGRVFSSDVRLGDGASVGGAVVGHGGAGAGVGDQALPELGVLVAVDDEVDGGVDGGQQVGDAHHQVHVAGPGALNLPVCAGIKKFLDA